MPNSNNLNAGSHRFGFNGQMNDNEVHGSGNSLDFGARIYNPRLGRFLSTDPKIKDFPFSTPYSFAGNNPIAYVDSEGEHPLFYIIAYFVVGTLTDAALQYGINYAIYEDPTIAFEKIDWADATVTGVATAASGGPGGIPALERSLAKNLTKTVFKKVSVGELIEASVDYTDEEGIKVAFVNKRGTEFAMDLSTVLMFKKLRKLVLDKMKLSSAETLEHIKDKNTMSPDLRIQHEFADDVVNSKLLDDFFNMLENSSEHFTNESIKNSMKEDTEKLNNEAMLQFDMGKGGGSTLDYHLNNGATRIDNTRVAPNVGALNGVKNLFKAKTPVREVYKSVRFL